MLNTSNGGTTWELIDSPNSHNLYQVNFFDDNLGWVLGEGGTILKTTNGGAMFMGSKSHTDFITKYILSQNYPNPFNPSTVISWQLSVSSFVTLKVYDILGREVATIVNEEKPAGSYEVEFDGAKLPSGVYFYQLQAGDPSSSSGQVFRETKKMILIK